MAASKRSLWVLLLLVLAAATASQWWGAQRAADVGSRLAALVQPGDIQMLSSTTCAYCAVARAWLTEHQVAFSECFIETDRECAFRFAAVRGQGTPVLLVRGQVMLGFDAERVARALSLARG